MITSSPFYAVPEEFLGRLETVFSGRLRIRWSFGKHAWIIEQKVGRAALDPIRTAPHRDDLIQARDGYAEVMVIQPGNRMACEFCNLSLKVPVRSIAEVPCTYCLSRGRDARVIATYWPLDETLIDHLKSIDPERRGGREMLARLRAEVDEANAAMVQRKDHAIASEREAIGKYYFPQIMGIPSVGWTPGNNPRFPLRLP